MEAKKTKPKQPVAVLSPMEQILQSAGMLGTGQLEKRPPEIGAEAPVGVQQFAGGGWNPTDIVTQNPAAQGAGELLRAKASEMGYGQRHLGTGGAEITPDNPTGNASNPWASNGLFANNPTHLAAQNVQQREAAQYPFGPVTSGVMGIRDITPGGAVQPQTTTQSFAPSALINPPPNDQMKPVGPANIPQNGTPSAGFGVERQPNSSNVPAVLQMLKRMYQEAPSQI